MRLKM